MRITQEIRDELNKTLDETVLFIERESGSIDVNRSKLYMSYVLLDSFYDRMQTECDKYECTSQIIENGISSAIENKSRSNLMPDEIKQLEDITYKMADTGYSAAVWSINRSKEKHPLFRQDHSDRASYISSIEKYAGSFSDLIKQHKISDEKSDEETQEIPLSVKNRLISLKNKNSYVAVSPRHFLTLQKLYHAAGRIQFSLSKDTYNPDKDVKLLPIDKLYSSGKMTKHS